MTSDYKTMAPPLYMTREAQGGVYDGKLHVFGGFIVPYWEAQTFKSQVYDPATNAWSLVSNVPLVPNVKVTPRPHGVGVSHMGNAAVEGDGIYLAGGLKGAWPAAESISDVLRYHPPTDSWFRLPDLPASRGGGGAAVIGRTLHFVGGGTFVSGKEFTEDHVDHWAIDLDTVAKILITPQTTTPGTAESALLAAANNYAPAAAKSVVGSSAVWQAMPPMRRPGRNHLGVTSHGGKLFVFGGQKLEHEYGTNQHLADVYDPASHRWKVLASLPFGLGHITPSVVTYKHGILVVGGTSNFRTHPNKVMFYDPETNTWTQLPGAGTAGSGIVDAVDISKPSQVCGIVDGRLYVQSEMSCYSGRLD